MQPRSDRQGHSGCRPPAPKNQVSRLATSIHSRWPDLEVAGTELGIDDRNGLIIGPTESAANAELVHEVFGERDVTVKVGMLSVVKEPAVDDAVPAFGLEHFGPVDEQNGTMPGGDVAINLP